MIIFESNVNLSKHGRFLGKTHRFTFREEIMSLFESKYLNRVLRLSNQELDWLSMASRDTWEPYLEYRYKFKAYPKDKIVADFPIYILIEPTSVCNIRCVMCYQIDPSFKQETRMGYMDFELFKKIVDEAKVGGTCALTLASRGEPTLHPKFGEMLRYVGSKEFLDVKINTNATRLTEQLCLDILESGVNEVVFSVDAATKETYEKIRVGGKFDSVVKNIDLFNKIRSKTRNKTITRISGVKVMEEQDEKAMEEFWSSRVDQVTIKDAIARWDTYNNPLTHLKDPCYFLWERMYVWFDGTVNPCDVDYNSHLKIGTVKENTIKELWHGEKYTELRFNHLRGLRNKFNPCDRCEIC